MTDLKLDILSEIADKAGSLRQVNYLYEEGDLNFLTAIILIFENRELTILAIADDDTIE